MLNWALKSARATKCAGSLYQAQKYSTLIGRQHPVVL